MSPSEEIVSGEWQNDWKMFVDFLAKEIQGSSKDRIASQFGSKQVSWSGVLIDKSLDELAPIVTIKMPTGDINLGGLGVADVSNQSVPCARDSVAKWDAIPIGAPTTFTAVFRPKNAIFPPVEVKQLTSGRVVVFVGLTDGRPIVNDG
ncbi:MAG: hypothetical protein U0941_23720 [Planctomycetaceae bacterium]